MSNMPNWLKGDPIEARDNMDFVQTANPSEVLAFIKRYPGDDDVATMTLLAVDNSDLGTERIHELAWAASVGAGARYDWRFQS